VLIIQVYYFTKTAMLTQQQISQTSLFKESVHSITCLDYLFDR